VFEYDAAMVCGSAQADVTWSDLAHSKASMCATITAVTNAMEKTWLALHCIRKMLFVQTMESMNPAMNQGLALSLAASDPSLNYHAKGLNIVVAHSHIDAPH